MSRTPFKNILSGYETPVYTTEYGGEINTGVKFVERSLSGSMTSRKKKLLSLGIMKFFGRLARIISYTSTRGYGALFLSCGLLTVTSELAKAYFNVAGADVLFTSILGAILALLAIPMLMVDKPFCIALQDFALTDYLFFEFFSIKRMHRQAKERVIPPFVMAVFGILFAALGMFLGTRAVFAVLAAAVAVYLSFASPEFAFFSTIIIIPVVPLFERGMLVLMCMIGAAFISFMRKVLFGKRVYSIEQYDILVILFAALILVSGIFKQGLPSFENSLSLLVMALGYPLANNLIANRRLAECALGAIAISALLTAGYTAIELVGLLSVGGASALGGYTAHAAFSSEGIYAAFLLTAFFSSGYFAVTAKSRPMRAFHIFVIALDLIQLILTGRVDALLALLAGSVAYALIRYTGKLAIIAAVILPLPLLVLLIPDGALSFMPIALDGGYTVAERFELWGASLRMLADNLLIGVGIGADSFSSAISEYGQTAPNSACFFIEIACEAGIFALIAFLLLLAVRAIHYAVYRDYITESRVTHLSQSAFAMTYVLVSIGMTEYFWADTTVYYLFWCIFGIGSAALRISKREHDDRVIYYGDLMSVDSSVMNVKLR